MSIPLTIENLTDTGFDFDATIADPGTYDLVVSTAGVDSARLNGAIVVGTAGPPPSTITAVGPDWGRNDTIQVTEYTITGTGLGTVVTGIWRQAAKADIPIQAHDVTATGYQVDNAWSIDQGGTWDQVAVDGSGTELAVFPGAVEVTPISVFSVDPEAGLSGADQDFAVVGEGFQHVSTVWLEIPPPSIESVSPAEIVWSTTTTIDVYGTGFSDVDQVKIYVDGAPNSFSASVVDDNHLQAYDVQFYTAPVDRTADIGVSINDTEVARLDDALTLSEPPPPAVVDSVAPTTITVNTPTVITLSGSNLDKTTKVALSGSTYQEFTPSSVSATEVVVEVVHDTAEEVPVFITVSLGSAPAPVNLTVVSA